MAFSRPLVLALVGMVLAAATFYAARGARERAADPVAGPAAPVTPVPSPAPPATARSKKRPAIPDSPVKKKRARPDSTAKNRTDAKEAARADEGIPRRVRADMAPRSAPFGDPGAAVPAGVPRRVGHALRHRRTVVLFIGQRGADDAATAAGVRRLRGLERVSVFQDGVGRLARYRAMLAALGVAQTPAVVIVGRDRQAQVIEGFVDAGTLFQLVVDAR